MTTNVSRIKLNKVELGCGAPARSGSEYGRTAAEIVPHCEAGGVNAPSINKGVTQDLHEEKLVMSDGTLKVVPVRRPAVGQCAHVDQISFTAHLSTLQKFGCVSGSQDEQVETISRVLESIFGFGITQEREKGSNFYKRSFTCGDYAQVGVGGQNETFLVFVYGSGALHAREGWESRLKDFLDNADRPSITRIDLAFDDFESNFVSVDWGYEQYKTGGFTRYGKIPKVEKHGDWDRPDGSGRTLYVGSRQSGKFLRIYEKGRQLGCKTSNWTRFEVELKSKDRVIPTEILTCPSEYLAGCYECVQTFAEEACRLTTKRKTAEYSLDRAIEICKTQMGPTIRFLRNYFEDETKVLDSICSTDPNAIPKRLRIPTSGLNTLPQFIHKKAVA